MSKGLSSSKKDSIYDSFFGAVNIPKIVCQEKKQSVP